ncbi:MAG: DUF4363 family protein [Ruminococcaceae bacterium]|nr:DUF4363 family protein [Oscillospiraceae bacterium]
MKSFLSACAVLAVIFLLILWSSVYCSETVALTLSAIDELERGGFSPEKAERIYSDFKSRGDVLRYFTVTAYVEEIQIALSALRYVPETDTDAQRTLIEEARVKLEKLRIAGTFSLETVV